MQAQEKIGPYRLIAPLGSGGMGTVWRAWDERLKRPVALKRILPATNHSAARERFRREAEAGARLNHPAIVHLYDILETAEGEWIVLELVDGPTLQELLREGPLDLERAMRLGREIAEGLAEAHAQGLLHRDLKASNVMVAPGGRAKILDFGVAKQLLPEAQESTLSAPGLVVGTTYAMSPEQAMGLPLDARSDLFALGSLLYEMVTGEAPFRAETAAATLARVCHFRPLPLVKARPGTPLELSNLIGRLLEKEPVDRPASAAEVAAALAGASESSSRVLSGSHSDPDEKTLPEGYLPPASGAVFEPPPVAPKPETFPARLRPIALWGSLVLLLAVAAGVLLAKNGVPRDPYRLYREGDSFLARFDRPGHLDRAIQSFSAIVAQDDRHAPAYAGLARAYWLKFDGESKDIAWLNRARSAAHRAVELDAYLAAARVSLGLVCFSSGQLGEARKQLDQALLLKPLDAEAFYGLARVHEARGALREAEAAYRRAVEIRPDRMYFDGMGSLYLRESRLEEAVTAFRRSIQLAPDSYLGYRNLAAAYYSQGKLGEAASQLQNALQIRPDATLYSNLGTLYFARGLYEPSVDAFEKALASPGGSNKYLIWGNLGDAYRWAPGQRPKSRGAYRRAIQLIRDQLATAPDDVVLSSRLALFLAKRDDCAEALALVARIEQRSPEEAGIWYRLAVASETCQQRSGALAALQRALQAGLPLSEVKSDPELLDLREDVRYHLAVSALETKS